MTALLLKPSQPQSVVNFSIILLVSSASQFSHPTLYRRLTQLAVPNGAPELHQDLAGPAAILGA